MAELNIDVLNTLNLISEDLGKAYEEGGYNPFEEGYGLSEEEVTKLLDSKKLIKPLVAPKFLDQNNKAVSKNFALSLENTQKLITSLESKLDARPDYVNELKENIIFLKNRRELLSRAIEKLKNINEDSFALYTMVYDIDPVLSPMLDKSFEEELSIDVLAYDLESNAKLKAKLKALKAQQIERQHELARQKLLEQEAKMEKNSQKLRREALAQFTAQTGLSPKPKAKKPASPRKTAAQTEEKSK